MTAEQQKAQPTTATSKPARRYGLLRQQRLAWEWGERLGDFGWLTAWAALEVDGPLDCAALRRALRAADARYEILRSRLRRQPESGEPMQVVTARGQVGLTVVDWRGLPPAAAPSEPAPSAASLSAASLSAASPSGWAPAEATPPVVSLLLLRLADDRHRLLARAPACYLDDSGLAVLLAELSGRVPADAGEPPLQVPDLVAWQQELLQEGGEGAAFWRQLPTSAPAEPFPGGRAAPGVFRPRCLRLRLPPPLAAALEAVQDSAGGGAEALFLTVWRGLLARHLANTPPPVALLVDGRPYDELAAAVAPLAQLVPLAPLPCLGPLDAAAGPARRALADARGWQEYFDGASSVASADFVFQTATTETSWREGGLCWQPLGGGSWPCPWGLGLHVETTPRVDSTLFDSTQSGSTQSGSRGAGRFGALRLSFDGGRFPEFEVRRLGRRLLCLLAAAVAAPERPLARLPLLDAAETQQLLREWSAGARLPPVPRSGPLHGAFDAQARRHPERIALVAGVRHLTYGGLAARAARLAAALVDAGVQPDQPVALCLRRGAKQVVAILGVLRAGGAYVPLDPAYPAERLRFVLGDALHGQSQPVLVTAGEAAAVARTLNTQIMGTQTTGTQPEGLRILDLDALEVATAAGAPPPASVSRQHLAYVIYTSGSTGQPKGVLVTHGNALQLLAACERRFPLAEQREDAVWTLFHSYAFDFSVWELWGALAYGGRLVVVPHWVSRSAHRLRLLLAEQRVTVLNQTPSFFALLTEVSPRPPASSLALRWVVFGGEAVKPSQLAPWLPAPEDHVRGRQPGGPDLVNMYGITETTVHVTWRRLNVADIARPVSPIGGALSHLSLYVADPRGEVAAAGVPGELHVAGDGLARGYLRRPALTAQRFVPHAWTRQPGRRCYRAGDLVRFLPDGDLDYLGRVDHQVKVRGFRIEPGEIEAALEALPGVRQAAVLALGESVDERRLVGYAAVSAAERPRPQELREALHSSLPEYMVPAAIVVLDALPLTTNGKVDRRALAELNPAELEPAAAEAPYVPPRDLHEEVLAGIWGEVLGLERVSVVASFFDLGGHSLLAAGLSTRIRRQLGVEFPIRQIFDAPTVREQAPRLAVEQARERGEDPRPPLQPLARQWHGGRSAPMAVSFAQERLWFLDRLRPGDPMYNVPLALTLEGELRADALERAVLGVMRRHEALRTDFAAAGGTPRQVVHRRPRLDGVRLDLRRLGAEAETQARQLAEREVVRPFQLDGGSLLRLALLRLTGDRHVLLLTLHHIVTDGWSMGILAREMRVLYAAECAGAASPLPVLSLQYADYAAWQRSWLHGDALQRQLDFWQHHLAAAPSLLELPTDRPRRPLATSRGRRCQRMFPSMLTAEIGRLARERGATVFLVLLAAWAALLGKLSGQRRVVVGTAVANRATPEVEELIGFFVNTLALHIDLHTDPGFGALLERVRDVGLEAFAHQDLPFEKLIEELEVERAMDRAPLFQTMLVLQNTPQATETAGGESTQLRLRPLTVEAANAPFDLNLVAVETPDGLQLRLTHSADLFDSTTADRWLLALETLLRRGLARPHRALSRLSLLTAAEQHALCREFNDTASEPESGTLRAEVGLGGLLAGQLRHRPDALAVDAGDVFLSYRGLAAASQALAGHLRQRGFGPEQRLGVCAERGPRLVVALLAVQLVGAAFVPLDPAYPSGRLRFMAEDADLRGVLVSGAEARRCLAGLPALPVVDLDAGLAAAAALTEQVPSHPEALAYVIYTSGSTGRPKGVAVSHRGVANTARALARCYGIDAATRVLQFSSLSFDALIAELGGTLAGGATLCLAPAVELRPGPELLDLLHRRTITNATLPPSVLAVLEQLPLSLRSIIVAGEACSPELARRWGCERSLINGYGPTEATVCVSTERYEVRRGRLDLGRPLPNTRLYVLDSGLRQVAAGVAGELLVGGVGLARGYLARPTLTALSFVPDPFAEVAGERQYRTGDRVRWLTDGRLQFLGRIDDQVKLRGLRIELGEIESVLTDIPRVREAKALVIDSERGQQLLAFLVLDGDAEASAEDLRGHLQRSLPLYMVPTRFIVLEAMPISPNGKVDREALPLPEFSAVREYLPPRNAVEETLAQLWREVLDIDQVGVRDNLFELGAHSLLLTRLLSRVQVAFGVELQLRDVFQAPVLEVMAEAILAAQLEGEEDSELEALLEELGELSEEEALALSESVDGG